MSGYKPRLSAREQKALEAAREGLSMSDPDYLRKLKNALKVPDGEFGTEMKILGIELNRLKEFRKKEEEKTKVKSTLPDPEGLKRRVKERADKRAKEKDKEVEEAKKKQEKNTEDFLRDAEKFLKDNPDYQPRDGFIPFQLKPSKPYKPSTGEQARTIFHHRRLIG